MVVTTRKGFTKGAINEVKLTSQKIERYSMELVGFKEIAAMLKINRSLGEDSEPWYRFSNTLSLSYSGQVPVIDVV